MKMKQSHPPPKVFVSSLALVSSNYALRCDAKYADSDVIALDKKIRDGIYFELGEILPSPFVKGIQPDYLDQPKDDSVPVINTLSIQNLAIRTQDCRHIARDDFDVINYDRKLRDDDVLLTVDGGVSIGKPALFDIGGISSSIATWSFCDQLGLALWLWFTFLHHRWAGCSFGEPNLARAVRPQ